MASAALISLLHTLDQIPHSVPQITSLQNKLSRLLVILDHFSQKNNLSVAHLEEEIRDASFEAEDLVEPNLCSFSEMNPDLQDKDLFQDLQKVLDKFDSSSEALSRMKDGEVEEPQPNIAPTAGSSRFIDSDESNPVGLEDDLLQMKDRLTGSPSKLDIISIVGMGGIGKTTLARKLYNDPLIEDKFQIRAWVVVSQQYRVQEMFVGLLDSTKQVGSDLKKKSIEQLSELLYKSLKGRRYLIVMDDVWDNQAWDEVRRFFPNDNNGSRVMLTTRLSDVAEYSHSLIHSMNLLNPETSWKLLREKVFGGDEFDSTLEEPGRRIAQICKGLPLAIIVIGGLLSKGSGTEEYWNYIAKNITSAVTGDDVGDQFKRILSLSYNSLPHHLKVCFLHMGVFPEDHEIFISQLIKIWIAEGFIRPPVPKSFEDLAHDYLKDLLDRSLLLVRKRNHDGGIKTCIIHDMLRELCVKKGHDDKFLQIMKSDVADSVSNGHRRVSVHSDVLDSLTDKVHHKSIRSVLYYYKRDSNNHLLSFTASFRLLRVFDALRIIFYEFPIQIVELAELRYLAFLYRGKVKFPALISKLQNLQTLIVFRGEVSPFVETLYLPSAIWEMPKLRHLWFDGGFIPHPYPGQIIGKNSVVMKNLQTLSGVKNFKCTKKVFEIMSNLRKLGVSYFYDKHSEWTTYEFDCFVKLEQLETLKCLFFLDHNQVASSINFAFPVNLKKLTLSGCRLSWEKMKIIYSLSKLEVLKLKNMAFDGPIWEPNEEEVLSNLKFLLIYKSLLKQWIVDCSHFPHLRHLVLVYCPSLVNIPSDFEQSDTLQTIELYECSSSAVQSARQIQKEQQEVYENTNFRVRVGSIRDYNFSRLNTSLRKAQGAAWSR